MTNYIIKKNAQRLINYIDMINEAKNRNLRHEKEIAATITGRNRSCT